jgi:hypothetical protein
LITEIHQNVQNIQLDTIQIISHGKFHDQLISISGILYINGTKTIDIKGNINKQNESDPLTISAYSSYYLLKQLQHGTTKESFNNNVTVLIDNKTISRIKKLKQRIYPNACLQRDFEVLQAVSNQIYQINNVSIEQKFTTIIRIHHKKE